LKTTAMKYFLSLVLLAAILFLFALNQSQLHGSTEPRVAGVDAGMLVNHDWVTPRLNGRPFLEKPPLSNWLGATSIQVFGAQPFAVRLVSSIASIATALFVFVFLVHIGKTAAHAWLAAMFLVTMAEFWSNGRQVGEDALLACGVSLCLLSFAATQLCSTRWWHWPLFIVGLSIATLSKGVLGLAYPGAVIFAYLLSTTVIEKRFTFSQWLTPAVAALIGLLPLLVWLFFLYQRNGIDAVVELLLANSVGRFSGDFDGNAHVLPFYFYFSKLPELFLPWNILVYLGLWQLFKVTKQDATSRFFICWLIAPLLLLSLSSGKRMVYALSLYPAAAVIAASYCKTLWQRYQWRYQYYLIGGLLALMTIASLVYAVHFLPKQDKKESLLPVVNELMQRQQQGENVALYQPIERLEGAVVFYSGQNLPVVDSMAALRDFVAVDSHHVVLVGGDNSPVASLRVLSQVSVGRNNYLFVGQ